VFLKEWMNVIRRPGTSWVFVSGCETFVNGKLLWCDVIAISIYIPVMLIFFSLQIYFQECYAHVTSSQCCPKPVFYPEARLWAEKRLT